MSGTVGSQGLWVSNENDSTCGRGSFDQYPCGGYRKARNTRCIFRALARARLRRPINVRIINYS